MIRSFSALVAAFILVTPALAHFVFVVPQTNGKDIQIVFSDDLEPDEGVPIDKVAAMSLFARDAAAKDSPLKLTTGKHSLTANLPADTRVLFGTLNYGVMQKGTAAPYQLRYHPKAIVGDAFAKSANVGERVPLEVIAVGKPGSVRFQVLAKGKPLPSAELNVLVPGADKQKVTADADGLSPVFTATGRFGVWTKHFEKASGQHDGKMFEEVRHYATLVADVGAK